MAPWPAVELLNAEEAGKEDAVCPLDAALRCILNKGKMNLFSLLVIVPIDYMAKLFGINNR